MLAALYILLMYQRTMTGPVREGVVGMRDLDVRELTAVWRRCCCSSSCLLLKPLLSVINPSVEHTMTQVDQRDPQPTVTEGEAHQ